MPLIQTNMGPWALPISYYDIEAKVADPRIPDLSFQLPVMAVVSLPLVMKSTVTESLPLPTLEATVS